MICAWMLTSSAEIGSSATMKSGLDRQRAGDGDALALAAGELVRVALRRRRAAGRRSSSSSATRSRGLGRGRDEAVEAQRLGEDVADRHARVERGVGVLEHHLHAPAQRPDLRGDRLRDVLRPRSGSSPRRACGCGRSAAPRVDLPQPDSPTRPTVSPRRDVEVDAVDGVHDSALCRRSRPCGSGKCFTRPRTSSSGSPLVAGCGGDAGRAPSGAAGRPVASLRQAARRPASPSSARRGRARPPASGGCSAQRSMRNGQRGAKRQPCGRSSGSGGAPSIVVRRRSPGVWRSSRGTALISAQV